ncbi:inositol monophosphatase [Leifsonia sp. LS1]|uniref:inositol monophosphatase family protein n=1 Tax=Leifsonia sp. LS1 TaxID=2828483 RepID=UPI001CFDC28D|nr:inositol monophosphatase family protein [Leifsonia sp. LS1]GIT81540.1 inositol monophosphatase [Leifsonia sp. LS1]
MTSNAELRDIAVSIAKRAAAIVQQRRRDGVEIAASKSSVSDIVTRADREAEELIRGALSAARPADGFLGEESGAEAGTSGLTWVVDPIDGTVNYAYGIPDYAVSIAVVEGDPDPASWRTLAGAVVAPERGDVFAAALGEGATLNGGPLRVNGAVELPVALVGTGFSYDAETRMRQAEFVGRLIGEVRDIRRIGSAALDLCGLAAGRLDAYYERGLNPWDHAAGALVAREAGARVGGLDGGPEGRRLLLAAAPGLYEALEPRIAAFFGAWD